MYVYYVCCTYITHRMCFYSKKLIEGDGIIVSFMHDPSTPNKAWSMGKDL